MSANLGMAISMMVKLSEDTGLSSAATNQLMGLSASCLFLGSESDNKYVKLEWNFEDSVNLIDWIGLFHEDQCNPLLYMDYKSYGVCGAKAGSVDWKITNAHLNADNNNNSLCFRYYNGLTGALRASSPPLLVYSDAQIAVTSIVCKQLPESKSVSYYAKISSSASGCQYKTPNSSKGCWPQLSYLFPADRSSELRFAVKERTNHWSKSSSSRVLGVVNISVLDVVQSANQDLAFVLRPLPSSTTNSPAFINKRHTSTCTTQHKAVNHCQIVVSCRLQPQQKQSYNELSPTSYQAELRRLQSMTKLPLPKEPGLSMSQLTIKHSLQLTVARLMLFFRTMFSDSQVAKKFGCGQMKTKAIITGVMAPYSVQCLLKELGAQPYSISTDASNHKEIKLFPLVIRFFTADKGVQVRLLDMKDLPGEDSQLVADFIAQILDKHGLKWQNLVSFCADNATVNFGGPRMQGPNNVFKKLLLKKKNLIPVGCPAHVFHNAAQKGADRLPLDIETVIFKLASYFKGSTSRHEQFKDVCEFLETKYETIPTHGPTRWLTLGKVINKILKLWEPLTALFGFANKPPLYLEKFFASEESLSVLQFLQSVLGVFEKPLLQLQKSTALLPELVEIVNSFKQMVVERKAKEFFGATTATSLERLDMEVKERLSASFQDFYTTVIAYIDKWIHVEFLPTNISWIMLKENNIEYTEAVELAKQVAPEIAVNDELFNEVVEVNRMLRQIPEDVFEVYQAETKWQKIFKDNDSLPNLYRLVSIIFSIQLANAFVERVFSLCKAQWTDTRNSLQVETVKALLQVRVNFDMDCAGVYNLLMKEETLRRKIQGGEKWE